MTYTSLKIFSDVEHVKTDTTEKLLHAAVPKYTAFNIYTRNYQNAARMPLQCDPQYNCRNIRKNICNLTNKYFIHTHTEPKK